MPTGWIAVGGAPCAAVAHGHAATSAQASVTTATAIHRPVMSVVSTATSSPRNALRHDPMRSNRIEQSLCTILPNPLFGIMR
jgi:hypothetical protein